MNKRTVPYLPAVCAAVVAGIMLAGLWPRKFSGTNGVSWLEGRNGLRFQRFGVAYCPEPIPGLSAESGEDRSISIEMCLKAYKEAGHYLPRILSFYDEKEGEAFLVGQWKSGIVVRRRGMEHAGKPALRETGARGVLARGEMRLITVVSGKSGTSIYVNGKLENFDKGFGLPGEYPARPPLLVLGNSPDGKNPWEGEICGLAVYGRQLSREEVLGRYQAWLKNGDPPDAAADGAILRYRFDERGGSVARNGAAKGYALEIPHAFSPPYRMVLAHDWRELRLYRSSLKDVVVNIAGFVPFGFFFMAWFSGNNAGGKGWKSFTVILLAFGISLAIELVQAYLPARYSSAVDVACNTAGSMLGVLFFRLSPYGFRGSKDG